MPQDESVQDDERFIEIEEQPGYQTAYSQLIFAGKRDNSCRDHLILDGIQDARTNLAQSLSKLSTGHPGVVTPMIGQLEPKAQEFLGNYLRAAQVNLN